MKTTLPYPVLRINMHLFMFIIGAIIYGTYTWMVFEPSIRNSKYLIPLGLLVALIGNIVWLLLARDIKDNKQLMLYGLIWDMMITASFLVVPIVFFNVRLNFMSAIGCLIAVAGIVIMKLSSL